jgi:hypothetical protein
MSVVNRGKGRLIQRDCTAVQLKNYTHRRPECTFGLRPERLICWKSCV